MKKSGAIYYKNIFSFLYCGNNIRYEKHRVIVVFGNFVQIFDIDDYYVFVPGRFFRQMVFLFLYHRYWIPVLGNFFRPLLFFVGAIHRIFYRLMFGFADQLGIF